MTSTIMYKYKCIYARLFQKITNIQTPPLHYYSLFFKSVEDPEKEPQVEAPQITYVDRSVDYGAGRKHASLKLQELFDLTHNEAYNIVAKHRKLTNITAKTLGDNYHFYKKHGVGNEAILNSLEVLAHKDAAEKVNWLHTLPYELNTTIQLVNLGKFALRLFVERQILECRQVAGGRIAFLSKIFKIPPEQVCGLLVKRHFLRSLDMKKIQENLECILSHNIDVEAVLKDTWVLRYSTTNIKDRLDLANERTEKVKTWMVRSNPEVFNKYVNRRATDQQVLGNHSLAEYLVNRLNCSQDEAHNILNKHKILLNRSMLRIRDTIDFLFRKGFKPEHIIRNPKILTHSVQTTERRLAQFEEKEIKLESLSILTKSNKQYQHYFESVVKNKKKEKQENNKDN